MPGVQALVQKDGQVVLEAYLSYCLLCQLGNGHQNLLGLRQTDRWEENPRPTLPRQRLRTNGG